ncbi:unnamed protein product, partial [Protopolystoma xenopodis]
STCNPNDSATSRITNLPSTQTSSTLGDSGVRATARSASVSRPAWKAQPHIGKYKLIRTLGRGNFAKVKLAQHVTTGREVGFGF